MANRALIKHRRLWVPESTVQPISTYTLKKMPKIHHVQRSINQFLRPRAWPLVPILVLFLFGCAASGPDDNPLTRGFTWYSYLGGDDIRNRCAAGSPDALRFVYNARWHDQVRTYEVRPGSGGRAGVVEARVLGQGDIATIRAEDVMRPWRGDRADSPITPVEFDQLAAALDQAIGGPRMQPGKFLRSDAYYWVATACRNGVFHLAAWQGGDQDLRRLPFPSVLQRFDATGIRFEEPRDIALGPFRRHDPMTDRDHFEVQLGEDRIRTGPRL